MATPPSAKPTLTDPPTPQPLLSNPTDFRIHAEAQITYLPTLTADMSSVVSYIESTAQQVYDNTVESATNATNAATSATNAEASALEAQQTLNGTQGAANNSGLWSNLTGALSTPASVYHNGLIWILKSSIADVASSEPGVSNDWEPVPMESGNIAVSLLNPLSSETISRQSISSAIKETQHVFYYTTAANQTSININVSTFKQYDSIIIHHMGTGEEELYDTIISLGGFEIYLPNTVAPSQSEPLKADANQISINHGTKCSLIFYLNYGNSVATMQVLE